MDETENGLWVEAVDRTLISFGEVSMDFHLVGFWWWRKHEPGCLGATGYIRYRVVHATLYICWKPTSLVDTWKYEHVAMNLNLNL